MTATDNLSPQFVPIVEAEEMAHLPLDKVAVEDAKYLDNLYEGRGVWEGRGFREHGMQNPIEVVSIGGRPTISDGHHRLLLAKRRGDQTVPVIYKGQS